MVHDRLRAGMKVFRRRHGTPTALVAAGGVAANEAIRKVLQRVAFEAGIKLVVPPARALHRQRRHDRLGRRRAAGARPHRSARLRAARALAARGDRRPEDAAGDACRSRSPSAMTFDRIAVLGGGAWGTALANVTARAGREVTLWEHDADERRSSLRNSARADSCPACGSRTRSR